MASKTVTPLDQPPKQTRGSGNQHNKNNDIWTDNIHLRQKHEDPSVKARLENHNKLLSPSDKYVDYIKHVEN